MKISAQVGNWETEYTWYVKNTFGEPLEEHKSQLRLIAADEIRENLDNTDFYKGLLTAEIDGTYYRGHWKLIHN